MTMTIEEQLLDAAKKYGYYTRGFKVTKSVDYQLSLSYYEGKGDALSMFHDGSSFGDYLTTPSGLEAFHFGEKEYS